MSRYDLQDATRIMIKKAIAFFVEGLTTIVVLAMAVALALIVIYVTAKYFLGMQ